MRIVAKKSELLRVATIAAAVADDHGTMPSYSSIVLSSFGDSLSAMASSCHQQVEMFVTQSASEERVPGTTMVSAIDFLRRVKSFESGDVVVEASDRQMEMSQGEHRRHNLAVFSDPPPKHAQAPDVGTPIQSSVILSALSRLSPTMGEDMSRPSFSGIRITPNGSKSTLLATENSRMARIDADFTIGREILVPPAGVRHIVSMYGKSNQDLRFSADNSRVFVLTDDGTKYSTGFVGGPYTDLSAYFPPRDGPSFVFKKTACADAIDFVMTCKPHLDRIRLMPRSGGFCLRTHDEIGNMSEEFVSCSISDGYGFSCSIKNLLAGMTFFDDGIVRITTIGGDRRVGGVPGNQLVTAEDCVGEYVICPYLYDKDDLG